MAHADDVITQLEAAELAIATTLAAGEDVVEYEIGGRMVRREGRKQLTEALDDITNLIAKFKARRDGTRATNYARLSKRF